MSDKVYSITLPVTVGSIAVPNTFRPFGIDLPGTPVGVVSNPVAGTNYLVVVSIQDNAATSGLQISGFASGDSFRASGFYFV